MRYRMIVLLRQGYEGRGRADLFSRSDRSEGEGLSALRTKRVSPAGCLDISSRKEVIQPQVPLRLPCYDLVLVTELTFGTPEMGRLRVLPASMT
jgi:hypothetical protein